MSRDNLDLKLTWDLEGEKLVLLEALQVSFEKIKHEDIFFLQAFDTVAVSFFFVEYVARLLISPNKKKFVKDGMNLVKTIICSSTNKII